jgi:protein-S-isoprenylcysteine O-methyltransferase Ste14
MFAAKTYITKRAGIKVMADFKTASKTIKIIIPVIFVITVVFFVELAYHSFNLASNILPWFFYVKLTDVLVLKIAGAIILILSLVVSFTALVSFDNSWRVGIDSVAPGRLITKGAFSYSRNPYYTGLLFFLAGNMMLSFNLFFIIAMIFGITGINWQILNEERSLEKIYGKQYLDYKTKVRRYF